MNLNPKGEGLNFTSDFRQRNLIHLVHACNFVFFLDYSAILLSSFKTVMLIWNLVIPECSTKKSFEEHSKLNVYSEVQT